MQFFLLCQGLYQYLLIPPRFTLSRFKFHPCDLLVFSWRIIMTSLKMDRQPLPEGDSHNIIRPFNCLAPKISCYILVGGCPVFLPSFSLPPACSFTPLLLLTVEGKKIQYPTWTGARVSTFTWSGVCLKEDVKNKLHSELVYWPRGLLRSAVRLSLPHKHSLFAASLALHLTLAVSLGDKANLRQILP